MNKNIKPTYNLELEYGAAKGQVIAGIDEVGYGSLAGPVVVTVVTITPDAWKVISPLSIYDSKKLSAKKRLTLSSILRSTKGIRYGIGHAGVKTINKDNVLQATYKATERAVSNLDTDICLCLIDGKNKPRLKCPVRAIIKGDQTVVSIACASIIAKVWRDSWMTRLSKHHPKYGWENNSGYGTLQHRQAIIDFGITKWHRLQFVSKIISDTTF